MSCIDHISGLYLSLFLNGGDGEYIMVVSDFHEFYGVCWGLGIGKLAIVVRCLVCIG